MNRTYLVQTIDDAGGTRETTQELNKTAKLGWRLHTFERDRVRTRYITVVWEKIDD